MKSADINIDDKPTLYYKMNTGEEVGDINNIQIIDFNAGGGSITVADIIMYPEVTAERERLINDVHDEWFGYDEMAVERDLNAFILRLLNQKRQETGALYDAAASGNTPAVSGGVPSNVTVTRSP